jgi:hypothetical protein
MLTTQPPSHPIRSGQQQRLDTNHLSAYLDRHALVEKSQFDLLIAALARQRRLILLTAGQDFWPVKGLKVENRL